MSNYSWPYYSKKELQAVNSVYASGNVNYVFGNNGKLFEKEFAKYIGVKKALAVANGTLALDLCLRAIDVKKGDEIIVTSRSFIASASCISILGAVPVFVDTELDSQNISLRTIKPAITKKTKAIICVHFAGYPCDMHEICSFAKKNNLCIIEDCAQAHGARIKDRSVGSFGDINAWSFCNDKIMSTGGEGGMVTTNSMKLYKIIESFNNHGKNFQKINKVQSKKVYSFPNVHDSLGLNYRITEAQSAIGLIQLEKLDRWHKIRNRNAKIIIDALKNLKIVSCPKVKKNYSHAFYKLYLTLNSDYLKKGASRKCIIEALQSKGVDASFGATGAIDSERGFLKYSTKKLSTKNSIFLQENSIMLLVHPTKTSKKVKEESKIIFNVLKSYEQM